MPATTDVKFYKSTGNSLGGAITATQITSGNFNNMFGIVSRTEQVAGEDYYNCMYVKNTHTIDAMDNFNFWLDTDSPPTDTTIKWAFDAAGKNGTAQAIADVYAAPTSVTWHTAGNEPNTPNIGKLDKGEYYPIWVWWHVEANVIARADDTAIFNFSLFIPGGGQGDPGPPDPGGGGGGNLQTDLFGIRKIYATVSGGRTYNSNWHTATSHQWDSAAQTYGQLDPQDSMADLVAPSTCRAVVDADTDTLTAETNTDKNSWRYYIKDSADTEVTSTWKWSESTEVTVYYKAVKDFPGGSIQVHCRIMGPTEHWVGISHCGAAGHEYAYEIKKNGTNQFRKEEVHVSGDAGGYADNIIFPDTAAPYNVWIGMKLVTRKRSATSMKVEAWKDLTDGLNGGTWVKAGEILDDGTNWTLPSSEAIANYNGLPAGSGNCTKPSPMDCALTMDCSAIGLRVDNTQTQFKKFTIREIDPEDEGTGGGGGTPPPGGGGGGNPPPPPPTPTNWKMAVAGDWGCGSTTNSVINLCKNYDFTLGVGDNAYASASCWTNAFATLKPKLNSAYGNHEYSESGGIGPYKTFFGHDKTYFSFNFQNVHVLVCDTNINCDSGSAQHNFVTADLTTASNNSAIDWIFVAMHHPWFGSSSSHGYNDANQVQAFHSLFQTHKVALVLVGHNHNWQQSAQVAYNAGSPENPTVFDSTSPYVKTSSGLIHIVTGTGGHDTAANGKLYSLGSQPSFQVYQNRTHNGIFEIVASNNAKTLTCSFVDEDGSKFNTFVITAA